MNLSRSQSLAKIAVGLLLASIAPRALSQLSPRTIQCDASDSGTLSITSSSIVATDRENLGSLGEVYRLVLPEDRDYAVTMTTCDPRTAFDTVIWLYDADPTLNIFASKLGSDRNGAFNCAEASELTRTLEGGSDKEYYIAVVGWTTSDRGNYKLDVICDNSRPAPTGTGDGSTTIDVGAAAGLATVYVILIVIFSCCFCCCAGGGIYICLGGAICGIGAAAGAASKRRNNRQVHVPPTQVVVTGHQQHPAGGYNPAQGQQQQYGQQPPQYGQQQYGQQQQQPPQYGQTPRY